MPSIAKQRLIGLTILVVGLALPAVSWRTALTEETYRPFPSMSFPAGVVFGLGMMLLPVDGDELRRRFGVDKPQSIYQYPLP